MNNLISIIVPVFNRADEMAEFLSSFNDQRKISGFEIVIVDDGSSDHLPSVYENFKNKLSLQLLKQKNQGPGAARNLGMAHAKGDLFVFIDSDCTVPSDYIEKLKDKLDNCDFDAFGGPDTQKDDFPPFLKAVNYSMTSFIGTGGTRGAKKSIAKYYPRSFNMGIKKRIYNQIGGMNDLRHGQDMEYSNRIYKAGFKIVFFPDIIVYHKRRTNLKRFFKQIFNWGVTRINLGNIDPQMLKPVHALPAILLVILILTLSGAVFWQTARQILSIEAVLALTIAIFAGCQSAVRNRSARVGLLSVITLFTQVIAYGCGFLTALIKKPFLPPGTWITGFTKKYYK
jgi:glycosyltransferase involved in cell wall biosynthesis